MNLPLISAIGAVVFATIALAVLGAVLQKAIYDAEPLYAVLSVVLLVALIGGALLLDRGQRHDRE
jgi:membrane protease YdiL (CAAX protease family)